jgi:hypothetical protein
MFVLRKISLFPLKTVELFRPDENIRFAHFSCADGLCNRIYQPKALPLGLIMLSFQNEECE